MGAPQARLYELAKRLKGKGHDVTVLTAMPNYPTGRIFDGYRGKVRKKETLDGMKVVRTCLYPSKSSRTLPRLLSYLSFGISSALLGPWSLGKQDVVLIESPPPVHHAVCTFHKQARQGQGSHDGLRYLARHHHPNGPRFPEQRFSQSNALA